MYQWVGESAAKGGQQGEPDGKSQTGRQEGIPLLYTESHSYPAWPPPRPGVSVQRYLTDNLEALFLFCFLIFNQKFFALVLEINTKGTKIRLQLQKKKKKKVEGRKEGAGMGARVWVGDATMD